MRVTRSVWKYRSQQGPGIPVFISALPHGKLGLQEDSLERVTTVAARATCQCGLTDRDTKSVVPMQVQCDVRNTPGLHNHNK